jgi:hypothetical protein
MARQFDRTELLAAFDEIGEAAVRAGTRVELAVYGGSALLLASNFRFASEDVDIAELERPWPEWLVEVVGKIAFEKGWSPEWLNDAVSFHLSPLADKASDHVEFGTFPRLGYEPGLAVLVPTAEYLLALKLKASRFLEPGKGADEAADVLGLMKAAGIASAEEAVAVMARYFPRSGADPQKQLFLLRHVMASQEADNAPKYPLRSV